MDPDISSSLAGLTPSVVNVGVAGMPPSVVHVYCVGVTSPVFVQSCFKRVDAGGINYRRRQRVPLVHDAHAEGVPSDSGDGPGLHQLPLVAAGVAGGCSGEELGRI